MIKFSRKNWDYYDPYSILDLDELDESTIYPTEDLLQFTNLQSGTIVDLGYYQKIWIVFIIKNEDWENPLVKIEFQKLLDALFTIEGLLSKYDT